MKLPLLAGALAALAGGIFAMPDQSERIVILTGDTEGYLSPCGCTSPMTGGIRRRATAIRALSKPGNTTILDNGRMVEGNGRQDQMKAETLAQTMAALDVTAINVGPADARLGQGMILELAQLSNQKLVSSSLGHPEDHGLKPMVISGPFLIGGATEAPQAVATALADTAVPLDSAVGALVSSAEEGGGLKPVLMLQGTHDTAAKLAAKFPQLALIQYSSVGDPATRIEKVGSTVLATAGEHGKHVIRLVYRNGEFAEYRSVSLGPEFRDDPTVSRYYAAYLERVRKEKLLDLVPRHATAKFAGSWSCTPCHASATHVWKGSGHHHALETLTKTRHDADPDCVSCHVVGLDSTRGFRSPASTPQLAGVGCESCHGPAAAHVREPSKARLPKISEKACVGCHNTLNSPNFDFSAYWRKIVHH